MPSRHPHEDKPPSEHHDAAVQSDRLLNTCRARKKDSDARLNSVHEKPKPRLRRHDRPCVAVAHVHQKLPRNPQAEKQFRNTNPRAATRSPRHMYSTSPAKSTKRVFVRWIEAQDQAVPRSSPQQNDVRRMVQQRAKSGTTTTSLRIYTLSGAELRDLPEIPDRATAGHLKTQLQITHGIPRFRVKLFSGTDSLQDQHEIALPAQLHLVLLSYIPATHENVLELIQACDQGERAQVARIFAPPTGRQHTPALAQQQRPRRQRRR